MTAHKLGNMADILAAAGITYKHRGSPEVEILCPFHDDHDPSCNVNLDDGVFHCKACHAQGGMLDMKKRLGLKGESPPVKKKPSTPEDIMLVGFDDSPPTIKKATTTFVYKNRHGVIYCHVVRWETENGKEVRPLTRIRKGSTVLVKGKMTKLQADEYHWRAPPEKWRAVYGAEKIAGARVIIITEGEKAADAATELFQSEGGVGITWLGGCAAVGKTPVAEAVKGKPVRLWADNDDEGRAAMRKIATDIVNLTGGAQLAFIDEKITAEKGYDCADYVKDGRTLADLKITRYNPKQPPPNDSKAESPQKPPKAATKPPPKDKPPPQHASDSLPRFLGTGNNQLYIWNSADARLEILSKTESGVKNKLLVIAPYNYWCKEFPSKNGFVRDEAVNYVISSCIQAGAFNSSIVKGIGTFIDGERVVLNAGDRIIMERGEERNIRQQGRDLQCMYARGGAGTQSLKLTAKTPGITDDEATEMAALVGELGWGELEHATYLMGWLVASVISGALAWRPHIWITGAAGSGKSWVIDNIIKPCFEEFAISATGNTSEAALRNLANDDSRPILYDEAEVKTAPERHNILNILALARASSTEAGASVSKSMMGGGVIEYRVRSCFLFCSITTGLNSAADSSRFLNLTLRQHALTADAFKAVCKRAATLTHKTQFAARFIMRAFGKARYINAAMPIFADHVEKICGDKRLADTSATVLASAFIFGRASTAMPSPDEVAAWLRAKGFTDESFLRKSYESDDQDILSMISTRTMQMNKSETTIAEVIITIIGFYYRGDQNIQSCRDLEQWLKRNGVKVELHESYHHDDPKTLNAGKFIVYISKNENLARLFINSSYESAWYETLLQNPHAKRGLKTKRVGVGASVRNWLSLPATAIVGTTEANDLTTFTDEIPADF